MTAPNALYDLVERFDRNRDDYHSGRYNETQVRREYIDPLFRILGWDIDNTSGSPEAYKDVVHEDAIKVGGAHKAPDYGFRIGGNRKFFVEAKKPAVNLRDDAGPAFQLRRYAWSANLPVSILTDFEELAVYDCRIVPEKSDRPTTARLSFHTFDAYPDEWDQIAGIFSKEAVLAGSLDAFADKARSKRGTATVDAVFLKEIESWREALASDLALHNPQLSRRELNFAVQMTIDRLIFLRMTEDRGIEDYGRLQALLNGGHVYARLRDIYRQADERYNSGLFHFQNERGRPDQHDDLTPRLAIGDETLKGIIRNLYFPDSPYEFSVLPIEVLGQVYEQFLGKVIDLSPDRTVEIEEKPEVRKAGGVYYTPKYIVDYIVEQTIGKLLEGKKPGPRSAANKLRIVDPACGSGSFLIGAYEFLLDWHRDAYVADGPEKHRKVIYQGAGGQWMLTTDEKKRILLNNIYGVDIDSQAVEVTKLSLLLKVLEGESSETLVRQLTMFHERVLPDLGNNIKCGNSLIGPDFYDNQQMSMFDEDESFRINAFDWKLEFSEVFSGTNPGFDAVIGNPPWLMAGYYDKSVLEHLRDRYTSATGKFDLYYLFVEKGTHLISPQGRFGMIVPNKFFHTSAAKRLRANLVASGKIDQIVDFGDEQIFSSATNYSCILLMQGKHRPSVRYTKALRGLVEVSSIEVPWTDLKQGVWQFVDRSVRSLFIKMEAVGEPLECMTERFGTGVQSGADKILTFDPAKTVEYDFDQSILRPILRGRDVRRFTVSSSPKLLLFPYQVRLGQFELMTEEQLTTHNSAWEYLRENKDKLAKRIWFGKSAQELSGHWYGVMYLDSHWAFKVPHLLTPSLSNRSNFAIGHGDLFATGTAGVTSVIPKPLVVESLHYLLGLLNSQLLSFYAIKQSPIFSGGYYKFSAPYLRNIPIKRVDMLNNTEKTIHDHIVALVKQVEYSHANLAQAKTSHDRTILQRQIDVTYRQIDRLVYDLYGLTYEEIAVVEGS